MAYAEGAPEPSLSVDAGGVTLDLVLIRAGQFTQGSPVTEKDRSDDEAQRHVTLTQDFYMGRTPVTVAQFTRFVEDTGYRTEAEKGKSGGFGFDGQKLVQRPEFNWRSPGFAQTAEQPVTIVTFEDARAFASWLTLKAHRAVNLPSEAQWEYAYRAGTRSRFYSGDADSEAAALGWFKRNSSQGTQPVALKKANQFGLHDMGGNVYEWCRDFYGPYGSDAASDPEQVVVPSGEKPRRVLRGGSFLKDAKALRAAARYRNDPGSRNADNGFRVIAALEATPVAASAAAASDSTKSGASVTKPGRSLSERVLIVGGVGAALTVLIGLLAWLLHKPRKSQAMRGAPPGVTFRPDADGFWFSAPRNLSGSLLHYRAFVAGAIRRAAVPIEANVEEQFVYTGGAPSDVEAEQIAAWGGAYMMGAPNIQQPSAQRAYSRAPNDDTDEPDSSPFRGYPRAY
ncbi:MAG: SUMF1/EgtB/PvdO family nonheme iron enzyme [Polyangiaceae bacterium]